MSKEWSRKISDQENVELEVNLKEIFGEIKNSSRLRNAIGQEIIDIIRERTQDGQKSWTGKSFRKYSDEYAESIDFKAYGKSKSEPNLTQSGDMLGLLTVKEGRDPNKIKIGWDDTLQSEKAHGHITGSVGVKRDFLGLTNDEIDRIKSKFSDDIETAKETKSNASELFNAFLEGKRPIAQTSLNRLVSSFFEEEEI